MPDLIMEIGIGIIFSLVGLSLLVAALLLFLSAYHKLRDWKTTSGVVIGYLESEKNQRFFYRPKVEFTAADGKSADFISSVGSQRKSYRVGKPVKVLYFPGDLSSAVIKSFSTLFLPGFFASIFGMSFFGMGAYFILSKWLV